MRSRLLVLKLIFKELKINSDISDVRKRKIIQKTIYLLQELGANLNYHFGWYIMGPYSPELTRDYYEWAEAERFEEKGIEEKKLRPGAIEIINKLRPISEPPTDIQKDDWLELIASILFLSNVSQKTIEEIRQIISEEKSHLSAFFDSALNRLKENSLYQ